MSYICNEKAENQKQPPNRFIMKKILLFVIVLFVLILSVNAQRWDERPFKINAGAVIGLPTADANGIYKMAYGVDILGEYRISQEIAFTADGSYGAFTKKISTTPNYKIIYGLVGIKYYPTDILYGQIQGGFSLVASTGTGMNYIVSPSIGIYITPDIDLSVKYQAQIEKGYNFSYFGIRLGFKIASWYW